VVIVGHSYGGMGISGAAEKMEKAIASFVMLDAFMPENGQSVVDIWPVAMRDGLLAAERGGAITVPPRAAEAFKVNEKDRAWVDAQCTPQPIRCFLQKLTLNGARERIVKKSYIRATGVSIPYFDAGLASSIHGNLQLSRQGNRHSGREIKRCMASRYRCKAKKLRVRA
jgi:pimeloyl-ACP methyl ester carboxylesterase